MRFIATAIAIAAVVGAILRGTVFRRSQSHRLESQRVGRRDFPTFSTAPLRDLTDLLGGDEDPGPESYPEWLHHSPYPDLVIEPDDRDGREGPPTRYFLGVRIAAERSPNTIVVDPPQALALQLDLGGIDDIEVIVASDDFTVARIADGWPGRDLTPIPIVSEAGSIATGLISLRSFESERDRSTETIRFLLQPREPRLTGRIRVSYVVRDQVIQSQLITADQSDPTATFGATTDFNISADWAQLQNLPERPRTTLLINDSSDDIHQITLRLPAETGLQPVATTASVAALETISGTLRQALGAVAPDRVERSRKQLENDLAALAGHGWTLLYSLGEDVRRLMGHSTTSTLQVVVPIGVVPAVPWQLIYVHPIDRSTPLRKLSRCPSIADPAVVTAIATDTPRRCPHESEDWHLRDVLCPFGFAGYRYNVEVCLSVREPVREIIFGQTEAVPVPMARNGIDRKQLDTHLASLTKMFEGAGRAVRFDTVETKDGVAQRCTADQPLIYFFCHGRFDKKENDTALTIGSSESVSPIDFGGWRDTIDRRDGRLVWGSPAPLIVINACESLTLHAGALMGFAREFLGNSQAVGVLGTEARVNQRVASAAGLQFLGALARPNVEVGHALAAMRDHLLQHNNLAGLNYTYYGFGDATLTPLDDVTGPGTNVGSDLIA